MLLGPPKRGVQGLLTWAVNNWTFLNGKCLLRNVDLTELWDTQFIDALAELFVEDSMDEHGKERDKVRAQVLRQFLGYSSTDESYGSSNDALGGMHQEPLPYVPPTEFTDSGYAGLDPPLG